MLRLRFFHQVLKSTFFVLKIHLLLKSQIIHHSHELHQSF